MESFSYLLPSGFSRKKLSKHLPDQAGYTIVMEEEEPQTGVMLDTFAGDVHCSNKLLFQSGNTLLLADMASGLVVEQRVAGEWSLAVDLADGPVASLLKKVSKLRAFLPISRGELVRGRGLLLDDERKTRARFHNLIVAANGKTVGIGSTRHLRGYDKAHDDLRLSLEKIGAISCNTARKVYDELDIKVEEYSAKPSIVLEPTAPAKTSATTIISAFLAVARRNEDGVVADHDTEFLHDYRVSLRKVRSLLSLFKGVYGQEQTVRLKEEFSSLMQRTNLLRDLDVYLLNRPHYFQLVPEDTHEGLAHLFAYISQLRRKEQKKVRKTFGQDKYRKRMKRLQQLFGDQTRLTAGPKADVASLDYACRLVMKRYKKVCMIARTIDDRTEDGVVHELRINCKKLRYLMEFFAPLFPEGEVKALVKALKLLQDNLGSFNDYSVQQLFLRQLLSDNMSAFGSNQLQVAESIGGLTAMLNRLQRKERGQVMKNFARFDSVETRKTFAKLYKRKEHAA